MNILKKVKKLSKWWYVVFVLVAIFGWHLISAAALDMNLGEGASVNPIKNMVTIEVPQRLIADIDTYEEEIGLRLALIVGKPLVERKCANMARNYFDIYAIILPYKVEFQMPAIEKQPGWF